MTAQELNQRFGSPGRIVFRDGFMGHVEVVLANKYGSATVALCGANVLSYRPTGQSEVLFRPKHDYRRGDSVHAGIPLCWPQFGRLALEGMAAHGFAKLMVFEVRGTEYSEEMTEITLGLKSDAETKKLWDADFDLEVKVSVSMKLNLAATTTNTGTRPLEFTVGFHPYFLVRNRPDIVVRGTAGLGYFNGITNVECVQEGDFSAAESSDHIFSLPAAVKHEFALLDSGLRRAIAVVMTGGRRLTIWNPGPETIGNFAELGAEDWKRFLCVEPVSDWPKCTERLAPGKKHTLAAAIQASLEGECVG